MIVDYNASLPEHCAFQPGSPEAFDRLGDVLLTWLLHPGTAFYVGYTDSLENLALVTGDPDTVTRTNLPVTTTQRQFAKLSYLFHMITGSGCDLFRAFDFQKIRICTLEVDHQAELLAHRSQYDAGIQRIGPLVIGSEVHGEIEIAVETGFVHDDAPQLPRHCVRQLRKRKARGNYVIGNISGPAPSPAKCASRAVLPL